MLNKVMLIGNLGADPEVRYMPSGEAVTNIRVATARRWKDKQTGENKEITEWHRVVFFNIGNYKLAEIAGEFLKKGSKVYVEGRLQTRKWQDKDGRDQYTTEIVGEQMHMLDSKSGGTASFGDTQAAYVEPQAQAASYYQQPAQPQYQPVPPVPPVPPTQPQYAPVPPVQPQYTQPPVQQQAAQFTPPPPVQQPFNAPPPPQQYGQQAGQAYNQTPPPPAQQFRPAPAAAPAAPTYDDFDNDVPF